jgi:predicted AlkP superfamily phosphohydrolase/phosphomutase
MRFAALLLSALLLIIGAAPEAHAKRVIVLGFDGLDPDIIQDMIDEGRLPNMSELSKQGGLHDLATSIPPQSPVAWSDFITGMDSGGHGIFDFLHRDPATIIPYLSTSRPIAGDAEPVKFGKYNLPNPFAGGGGGGFELLRYGKPFWETLEENGVPCMVLRMPSNFPVSRKATYELSGMGTPDVRGTYGSFSFYTTDHAEFAGKRIGGGSIYDVTLRNGRAVCKIEGPTNPLLQEKQRAFSEFTVDVDPDEDYALIVAEGKEILLKVGEWSDWVPISLPFTPADPGFFDKLIVGSIAPPVPVMTRFYLKEAHPHLKLYATPLDYDPYGENPDISNPPGFGKEMAEAVGRFYTEGMPEDTKALDEHVLTIDEFLSQSREAGDEIIAQLPWVLDKFDAEFGDHGFLFYYTGNHDQIGHMMYRTMDPTHPTYDPAVHAKYKNVMPEIMEHLDEMVGYVLGRIGEDTTLIIMSDHGFASWKRAMNLNSWLMQEGYLTLKNPDIAKDPGFFLNVDWRKTKAYGLGINGLYINERGREKNGIVSSSEKRALLEEIAYKLVKVKDDETGLQAVTKVYLSEDAFHDRGHLDVGPDAIVGYAKEMRCSNQSATGEVPKQVFANCDTEWSADHCMDHVTVAGTLLTNRPLQKAAPSLKSLAAAILAEFGIGGFPGDAEEDLRAIGYISAN